MLIVIGRVGCAEGRRDDFVQLMKTMQDASRQEPGCIKYGFFAAVEDPDQFVAVELWESREALETHFGAPSVANFGAGLAGLVAGAPSVEIHHVEKTTQFPSFD
jgi:quinol monooxygenase YgiN